MGDQSREKLNKYVLIVFKIYSENNATQCELKIPCISLF
jgi:hypothetical protein